MKTVVITGSTRGIGYGLAVELLKQGCNVVVNGRRQEDVDRVIENLQEKFDASQILGIACDVSKYPQVRALWDQSKEHFGKIDIWINNAGQAQAIRDFWEIPVDLIDAVVETNILGQMYGVKAAVNGMLAQGEGALYIMEGKGARGDVQKGMTLYSTTKRAGNYLFHALVKELEGSPVLVGSLSPGMVVTDLLTRQQEADPENWERTKRIFNILADKVETVTPWLAEEILKNRRHGAEIRWLTRGKVLWRFLTAGVNKRDLFDAEERKAV
jgi:NAD(P)-dependent dehydrogenase (short-subunit alcohol dehydrogenase family)